MALAAACSAGVPGRRGVAGGGVDRRRVVLYLAMMLLVLPMELCVRRIARARGEPTALADARWNADPAVPELVLTQIVYAAALVRAVFVRNVAWRGVSTAWTARGTSASWTTGPTRPPAPRPIRSLRSDPPACFTSHGFIVTTAPCPPLLAPPQLATDNSARISY